MIPEIKTFEETKLIGKKIIMSFSNDRTVELWRSFSHSRNEINNFGIHIFFLCNPILTPTFIKIPILNRNSKNGQLLR